MPELPEVETTRLGLASYVIGRCVAAVVVRNPRLRQPVPAELATELPGQVVKTLERRGKYLLLGTELGTVLLHLGMSGNLRILSEAKPADPHDHVDIIFSDGSLLRFHDPRRFGLVLWIRTNPLDHPLLCDLGPEPLGLQFTGEYLYQRSRRRSVAVKAFLMDQRVVVGVGNIYVAESLFLAGIHPARAAGSIESDQYERLVAAVRKVLQTAIVQGGTTLRDFYDSSGRAGYFQLSLQVYGRAGEPCCRCHRPIDSSRLLQRSTFYCAHCQR